MNNIRIEDTNRLPTFFYGENKQELPGAGVVISTCVPGYIAKVFKFDKDAAARSFRLAHPAAVRVAGYNIFLDLFACIGAALPEKPAYKELQHLGEMAKFYYDHNVKPNESYNKRYLAGKE